MIVTNHIYIDDSITLMYSNIINKAACKRKGVHLVLIITKHYREKLPAVIRKKKHSNMIHI